MSRERILSEPLPEGEQSPPIAGNPSSMPAIRCTVLVILISALFSSSAWSGSVSAYDPDRQLHVRDAGAAKHVREAIIRYIWKNRSGRIPPVQPTHVKEVSDTEFFH